MRVVIITTTTIIIIVIIIKKKLDKYGELRRELKKIWNLRELIIIIIIMRLRPFPLSSVGWCASCNNNNNNNTKIIIIIIIIVPPEGYHFVVVEGPCASQRS